MTNVVVDTFERSVSNAWGTPDTGTAWSVVQGSASDYQVDGEFGTILQSAAAAQKFINMTGTSTTDLDYSMLWKMDKAAAGNSMFVYITGRFVDGSNYYQCRVAMDTGGGIALQVTRRASAVDGTVLANTASGLSFSPGQLYNVRWQAIGTNPTNHKAKVWEDGSAEPGTWLIEGTDSQSENQVSGGFGVRLNSNSGFSNTPLTLSVDTITVTDGVTGPGGTSVLLLGGL